MVSNFSTLFNIFTTFLYEPIFILVELFVIVYERLTQRGKKLLKTILFYFLKLDFFYFLKLDFFTS